MVFSTDVQLFNALLEQFGDITGSQFLWAFAEQPLELSLLDLSEQSVYQKIQSRKRKVGWLTGRKALKSLLSKLGCPTDTSLLQFPNSTISLTHSGKLAFALGVLANPNVAGVGIDYESYRPMRNGTSRFYLTPIEQEWVKQQPSANAASLEMLRLWTVKEGVFKADAHNQSARLMDYQITTPADLLGQAHRTNIHSKIIDYTSASLFDGFLTIALTRGDKQSSNRSSGL